MVSFTLIANGVSESLKSFKGLKKGDLLSSFLFILIMEAFNHLLLKAREVISLKAICG